MRRGVQRSGGVEKIVERDALDGALGIELFFEFVAEGGEFIAFVVADDEVLSGESVTGGVLRDTALPRRG